MKKGNNYRSDCCGAPVQWRHFQGMLLHTEIEGKKTYEAKCDKCGREYPVEASKCK